ncbi:hypothetical protein EIP91_010110 [Steccherinum ochraceum]|uniref:Uncharacterized protein n=1 Tax=Steccherinum ochraceum TaxID=92696 RepID=A0A4R0S3P9_9APHY|nr:hypothetical protein EIP91_010110 [Steccherinum ochraceum]
MSNVRLSLLDRLLTDVEDETSTVDPLETMSTRSSTIVGIGTLTGRGIMLVGTGVIRAVSYVGLRRELGRIASAQRKSAPVYGARYEWRPGGTQGIGMIYPPLDPPLYSPLVELQRPGLYPRDISVGAWNLMLVELGRGHEEQLLRAFLRPQLSSTDLQIYVKQLSICALSEWQKYPHRKRDMKLESGLYSPNNERPYPEGMLGIGLLHILSLIQSHDPSLLHEIFDIDEFALVLCAATLWTIPDDKETGFDARTCILRSIPNVGERQWSGSELRRPVINKFVGCFATFISHREPTWDLGVIAHETTHTAAQDDALVDLMRNHSDMVASLCEENKDMSSFFCGLRPIVAVRRLWHTQGSWRGPFTRFLDALARHRSVHQLSRDLSPKQASFLTDSRFFTGWSRTGYLPDDMGRTATDAGLVKWFLAGFQRNRTNSPEQPPSLEACSLLANVIAV